MTLFEDHPVQELLNQRGKLCAVKALAAPRGPEKSALVMM
jgi:hypothetical protein